MFSSSEDKQLINNKRSTIVLKLLNDAESMIARDGLSKGEVSQMINVSKLTIKLFIKRKQTEEIDIVNKDKCKTYYPTVLKASLHLYGTKWAAKYNNVELLKKLVLEKGIPFGKDVSMWLAYHNQKDAILWAIGEGCPMDERMAAYAVRAGNSYLLELMLKNGAPIGESALIMASRKGRENMLEMLIFNNIKLTSNVALAAIQSNRVDILKYLGEKNCPMNETCAESAREKSMEMLMIVMKIHPELFQY